LAARGAGDAELGSGPRRIAPARRCNTEIEKQNGLEAGREVERRGQVAGREQTEKRGKEISGLEIIGREAA